MGYIHDERMVAVITGFECDVCSQLFDGIGLMSSVSIEHVFGYASGHDQEEVNAIICEPCYYKLLSNGLPSRCFKLS